MFDLTRIFNQPWMCDCGDEKLIQVDSELITLHGSNGDFTWYLTVMIRGFLCTHHYTLKKLDENQVIVTVHRYPNK